LYESVVAPATGDDRARAGQSRRKTMGDALPLAGGDGRPGPRGRFRKDRDAYRPGGHFHGIAGAAAYRGLPQDYQQVAEKGCQAANFRCTEALRLKQLQEGKLESDTFFQQPVKERYPPHAEWKDRTSIRPRGTRHDRRRLVAE